MPFPSLGFLQFQDIANETKSATSVQETTASLNGYISLLSIRSGDADALFEYRREGTSTWQSSSTFSTDDVGLYGIDVSGLSEDTTYEYRSKGRVATPVTSTGSIQTFTTKAVGQGDSSLVSAMYLARRHDNVPSTVIESETSESTRTSQMLDRRRFGNQEDTV